MQKVPLAVADWTPGQRCNVRVISKQHQSSESLIRFSTSSVDNDWKAGLGLDTNVGRGSLMLAGTKSILAEYSMEQSGTNVPASAIRWSVVTKGVPVVRALAMSETPFSLLSVFTEIFGGNTTERELLFSADPDIFKKWLSSLPGNPDMISHSLDPLHELLPSNLPVRRELAKAIRHYILERGLGNTALGPAHVASEETHRSLASAVAMVSLV
ncbi:hypothetical protein AALO_G00225600 [Alosa alosa]|uniref:MACPF domain-containing protein n=1 Tax=Alosa alosa TaxID=278164 RepID=A0AAV6FYY4_9TELE|nr:hypothetical protein AALO_G00225600 [Alosa alosa]